MQNSEIFNVDRLSKIPVMLKKFFNEKTLYDQIIPIVIAFLLSRTVVFSHIAPFGIAFYAGCIRNKKDILPLAAALIGYITIYSQVIVFKYIIVLALIYSVCAGFESRLSEIKSQFKMPVLCGICVLATGLFFSAISGFLVYDLLLVVAEAAITMCCVYFFSRAVFKIRNLAYDPVIENQDLVSCLILSALVLLSLSDVAIGNLSIGRILAVFLVLCLAQSGNMAVASIMGLIFGLAMGLSDKSMIILCVIYGFCAIICGIFSYISRLVGVSTFVMLLSIMTVYFDGSAYGVMWIIEALIAGVLSLFVSQSMLKRIKLSFKESEEVSTSHEDKLRELVYQRLQGLSEGYKEVYRAVINVSDRMLKTNYNNISTVFDMTARKACRGCGLLKVCWQREYDNTMDNLNKVGIYLVENGCVRKNDFPFEFSNRCIRIDKFLDCLNDSYKDWQMRKKLAQKQQQTRQLSCEQYISLAKVMEQTANDLAKKLTFDLKAEERIIKYFNKKGIMPRVVMVMIDEFDKTRVEIDLECVDGLSITRDNLLEKIAQITGADLTEFSVMNKKEFVRIIMSTKEVYSPTYAYVSSKKEGESVSGDNVLVFKTDRGKMVLQIGDGMGSGRRAAVDSAIAVGVVKKIIKAGFDNETAVTVLNSAMLLKSDDESITGVDITVLDLYTGKCEFVKLGAAPTYVMRSGLIFRVDSNSLPVGILDKAEAKHSNMPLSPKDIIVMVSDGVIANGDDFIFDILEQNKDSSMKEMCSIIMKAANRKNSGLHNDDMSIICCQI